MNPSMIFQQMLVIFVLISVGYVLIKRGILHPDASKSLSAIIANVCNPALMLMSVLDSEVEVTKAQLLQSFWICLGVYFTLICLGCIVPRIIRSPKSHRNAYNIMTIFGNVGFIGFPLVAALFGSEGVLYTVVFNVVYSLLIYTYGVFMIDSGDHSGESWKQRLKSLVNVGTVSGILCIIIYLGGIRLPDILNDSVTYMGRSTTFLSMVVIGIRLSQMSLRELLMDVRMYAFILVRQIIVPVALGLVLRQIMKDDVMFGSTVIIIAVPVGNMPLILAESSGKDGTIFSRGIILTTLVSVITIPLVALLI